MCFPGDSRLHDLALIKLTREVMLNNYDVMTICLPNPDVKQEFRTYCIDGWSKKDKGNYYHRSSHSLIMFPSQFSTTLPEYHYIIVKLDVAWYKPLSLMPV